MSETTPLLPNRKRNLFRKWKRNFKSIKSKGVILVLTWDAIINMYWYMIFSMVIIFQHSNNQFNETIFDNSIIAVVALPLLFCPIGGLIADTWTGRYRTIITSIYISFFAWIAFAITYLAWQHAFQNDNITISMTLLITACLFFVAFGSYKSVSLPYNVDQLMDASSDEINTFITWHMFCYFLVKFIGSIIIFYTQKPLVILCVSGFLIVSVVSSHCIFKSHLNRLHEVGNPVRLIASVLMYAKRNKYPKNRSALTYWENGYPSRIDFGKERYGGPFTEEEVENVKTVGRVIPVLLLSLIVCQLGYDDVDLYKRSANQNFLTISDALQVSFADDNFAHFFAAIFILIYQFVLYPCFNKYIPGLLKRIGLGLFFLLMTSVTYMLLTISDQYIKPLAFCPLGVNTLYNDTIILPIDSKWLILPEIIFGISQFLLLTSSLEFTVAQTPKSMRGIMVGLWNATIGISNVINGYSYLLYYYIRTESIGCLCYYYIGNTTFILIVFLAYLCLARRYKVRIRDYIVPIYQIAEEHITKYLDVQEQTS